MTTQQAKKQSTKFNILINSKVTTKEFKSALRDAYDVTLEKARKFLIDNPEHNKTALNRIKTEIKRRRENPQRYFEPIKERKEKYMNKNIYIGNLTRDPELAETSGGVKVCHFTIAINRSYAGADGERKTDFIPCEAWRKLAETIAAHVKKGNKVAVTGELHTDTYEDAQGKKRNSFVVVAQDIEFLSPRTSSEDETINKGLKPQLQPFDDDSDIPF